LHQLRNALEPVVPGEDETRERETRRHLLRAAGAHLQSRRLEPELRGLRVERDRETPLRVSPVIGPERALGNPPVPAHRITNELVAIERLVDGDRTSRRFSTGWRMLKTSAV
jgi:hypothetical protein